MGKHFILLFILVFLLFTCKNEKETILVLNKNNKATPIENPYTFQEKLSNAALSIIDSEVAYTPSYVSIKYPKGDVPAKTGVCTDVIIRAYRKLGLDLQKNVHEDMIKNFSEYPTKWGLKKVDTNIDHRRVPNLEVFFTRQGKKLTVSQNANHYKTGQIVTWIIGDKLPHIGIVTHKRSVDGKRPLLVHNVGGGQVLEDCLFNYKIVGHYSYGD